MCVFDELGVFKNRNEEIVWVHARCLMIWGSEEMKRRERREEDLDH